ncbi:MAG: DEAD/DEAH box helicase family protein [Caldilineaceae bacterium]|nr:DEAD/DEAH box helicase family protein [Caldilineaceae bacterium]
MIQLREYQRDLLTGVQASLAPEQARVMMQLPTGGGKTVIAGALLKEWLEGGRSAVWLTHRRELVRQTWELLDDVNVEAYYSFRWYPDMDAPIKRGGVAILMAQTVSRRIAKMSVWRKYGSNDLMIIDEAHHASAVGWTRAMRQWPGRILGMTATPWRLSKKEGFDHLFNTLLCGPQVTTLQSGSHLCNVQVRMPSPEWIIHGGAVGIDGDFTDSGIVEANQAHIMTAAALRFWQENARDRQTLVYAVSVDHAHNLTAVFKEAGVPAAALLGSTEDKERTALIAAFKRGILRVLVNVVVATEGFDLPDASCVVITRPTKSLTLYLQMVGRGLRPKKNGGNCLILDLAGNAELHGLPEEDREWSLEPRDEQEGVGDPVTVWCDRCKTVSPAASHNCQNCGAPFGKDCSRCGTWRAWKRWSLEKRCGDAHELVCDLCHRDAHIEAKLPISEQLEAELVKLEDEEQLVPMPGTSVSDSGLNGRLFELFKELLEEEKAIATGEDEKRQLELQKAIETREMQMADETLLESAFEAYLSSLSTDQHPQNNPQKYRMFTEWENGLRKETESLKIELARLKVKPLDKQLVFRGAEDRVMSLFRRSAQSVHLVPAGKDRVAELARREQKGKDRPFGASKSSATHPEQLKELALSLYSAGKSARQVAEELFANDFGTRAGRMIGPGQMAQMLKRWADEPDQEKQSRAEDRIRATKEKIFHKRGQAVARAQELNEQGLSLFKISNVLNDEGYRTALGNPYTQQAVRKLLEPKV